MCEPNGWKVNYFQPFTFRLTARKFRKCSAKGKKVELPAVCDNPRRGFIVRILRCCEAGGIHENCPSGCERVRGWRTGAASLAASAKLGADTGGRAGRVKAPSARRRPREAAGGLPASSRRRKRRPPRRAGRAAGTYRLPGQPGRAARERVSGLGPCRRDPAACEPPWSLVSRREDRGQRVLVLAP